MTDNPLLYRCEEKTLHHFPHAQDEIWLNVPKMHLVDTVTGDHPRLTSTAQAFWSQSQQCIYFRFICEDDHVVATMTNHDDPIYNEDVVEVFLSETGSLQQYKEFEVSPTNVKLDAFIRNIPSESLQVALEWHAEGWRTEIEQDPSRYVSTWAIPFSNFEGGCPSRGDQWRMNCYRIDRGANGNEDQYMAWSPTGAVNFHISSKFGVLEFV
ncbi:hypothetical protein D3C73_669800 [compost metagenome]